MESRKYPSLMHVYKQPHIMAVDEVVATEKIHGTNFRVIVPATAQSVDDIRFGSRNHEVSRTGMFYGGRPVAWFLARMWLLTLLLDYSKSCGIGVDVTLFGEAYGAGIQKGVRYFPDDESVGFAAFDIMVGDEFLTFEEFMEVCSDCSIPTAPIVWYGKPSLEAFDALLEQPSALGRCNGVDDPTNLAEGVVIRPTQIQRDVYGEWPIVKHKSKSFQESLPKAPSPGFVPAMDFAAQHVTAGRILNALGRLRDRGETLAQDMADMRLLAPEMAGDVEKELAHEWAIMTIRGVKARELQVAIAKRTSAIYREMLTRGDA